MSRDDGGEETRLLTVINSASEKEEEGRVTVVREGMSDDHHSSKQLPSRVMAYGERNELPVVTAVNTLNAGRSIESGREMVPASHDQRRIATVLRKDEGAFTQLHRSQ